MVAPSVYCGTGVLSGDTVRSCFVCPGTIDYIFAGVDAGVLDYGCTATPLAFNKSRKAFTTVSANTTVTGHALDFSQPTPGVCTYSNYTTPVNFITYTPYALAGCTGSSFTTGISARRLTIEITRHRLTSVVLQGESGGIVYPVFSWAGSEVSGVAVSNQLVFPGSGDAIANGDPVSDTGTCTVTF